MDKRTIEWIAGAAGGANVIAVGRSGTGKTHVSIGLGVEACRQCRRVRFFTATELVG